MFYIFYVLILVCGVAPEVDFKR